ncbi:MAG: type II secretion system protein [Candidatus Gastranaerophilaceae bacterium]|jgi:prepilin-type N-terminal cleavage/methylation domain-containing protein
MLDGQVNCHCEWSEAIQKAPLFRLLRRFTPRNDRAAFTLAEVLLTLTIIGIIASMTLPALMNSMAESEYNTGVKKSHADLSQAVKMIQANDLTISAGTGSDVAASELLRNDFASVMTFVKIETFYNIFGPTGSTYKYYKGDYSSFPNFSPYAAAVLNDGRFLGFRSYNNNCGESGDGYGVNACGQIKIDINGYKGPNM